MPDALPTRFATVLTTALTADPLPVPRKVRELAGAVTIVSGDPGPDATTVTATVTGTKDYTVVLDLDDPVDASTCSCPQHIHRHRFCKHLLALALTVAGRDVASWTGIVPASASASVPAPAPAPEPQPAPRPTPCRRGRSPGQPRSTSLVAASRHDLPDVATLPDRVPVLRDAVADWDRAVQDPTVTKSEVTRARTVVTGVLQEMLVDGAFTTGPSTPRLLTVGHAAALFHRAGRSRSALAAMEQCALRCPGEETYVHLFSLFTTPTRFGAGRRAQLRAWYRHRLTTGGSDLTAGERELQARLRQEM